MNYEHLYVCRRPPASRAPQCLLVSRRRNWTFSVPVFGQCLQADHRLCPASYRRWAALPQLRSCPIQQFPHSVRCQLPNLLLTILDANGSYATTGDSMVSVSDVGISTQEIISANDQLSYLQSRWEIMVKCYLMKQSEHCNC